MKDEKRGSELTAPCRKTLRACCHLLGALDQRNRPRWRRADGFSIRLSVPLADARRIRSRGDQEEFVDRGDSARPPTARVGAYAAYSVTIVPSTSSSTKWIGWLATWLMTSSSPWSQEERSHPGVLFGKYRRDAERILPYTAYEFDCEFYQRNLAMKY